MDNRLSLLMVMHFHQPVGNFGFVIEKISNECYEPFLDIISEFPDIKFNLHYSGILLEWFKQTRPYVIQKLKSLVSRGQIELVGGGFYEPILSALLPEDAKAQIDMLSGFIREEFSFDAKGCWIAERVWQQHLADTLCDAGIKYIILDDMHLRFAGIRGKGLHGHYITENNGKSVSVFGADKFLRYSVPFKRVKKTIDYLKNISKHYNARAVLYGDDGEKFGAWPGTHESVYGKRWLKDFLNALRINSGWLKTDTVSEYLTRSRPLGRIYIPDTSYQEMNEWSMLSEDSERFSELKARLKESRLLKKSLEFLREGVWKNFFVKYPESNHIHKRTILASRRIRGIESSGRCRDLSMLCCAKRELYKAHCNCAYWHGIFGGIYLYHLRRALYRHLINSENILDKIEGNRHKRFLVEKNDFDCNGYDEVLVSTGKGRFVISPADSGSITEWDLREKSVNLVNTLSRKEESYHKGFKRQYRKDMHYDKNRRVLFTDRFLKKNIKLNEAVSARYKEFGGVAGSAYDIIKIDRSGRTVSLRKISDVKGSAISINKRFCFKKRENAFALKYSIRNISGKQAAFNFAPEMNLSLTNDEKEERLKSIDAVSLQDDIEGIRVEVLFSRKADTLLRYPVMTVSQSQKEPERNYQATCILPVFKLIIENNKSKTITIKLSAIYL